MRTAELYKYNPGRCRPEELEATFVAREAVLHDIVHTLARRSESEANQHFLIIGPRGIGKTNLLIMIRRRVEAELSDSYVPLQTAEEEYSIASLRDFFAKALDLLLERERQPQLQAAAERVSEADDDDEAAEIAIAALGDHCRRSGRKLLLLVDNLDLILGDQLRDEAQIGRLRDVLMNDSFLVLVGAAPTHFEEVSGYDRPLHNFFRLIELSELSLEQMLELLSKRASVDGDDDLLAKLEGDTPKLQAIYHLTGGSPRLVLMLYQLHAHAELPEVRAALQMLLDDLTPYYKARLERLAPQQRKVMDTFARLGRPATPTELAEQTRLRVNQVNSILNRLKDSGFVSLAPQERRKTTLYMVSERLFRIWHQMRFSTAQNRRLEFLIEFIRIWYSRQEWREEAKRLTEQYRLYAAEERFDEAGRYVEHLEYLAAGAAQPELGDRLADRTLVACIESGDFERAQDMVHERLAEAGRKGDKEALAWSWFRAAHLADRRGKVEEKLHALEEALELKPDMHWAANNWGTALAGAARLELSEGNAERARELFEESFGKYALVLELKQDMHQAANNWGNAMAGAAQLELSEGNAGGARELFEESCGKYELALELKPDKHEAAYNWGNALAGAARLELSAGNAERARELFGQSFAKYGLALELKPDLHEAANNWGGTLAEFAEMHHGTQRDRLLDEALGKVGLAVDMAGQAGDSERERFYSAHSVHVSLHACAFAVAAANLGRARETFAAAAERLPDAAPDLAGRALVGLLQRICRPGHLAFCAQALERLREGGLDEYAELLEPFRIAVEYWQRDRDAEVLDRLNPEVRELVEDVIERGEQEGESEDQE